MWLLAVFQREIYIRQPPWTQMGVLYNSGGWLAPGLMCGCTTDGFQVGKRHRVAHVIPAGVHETAPRKRKKVFSDKKEPGRINISGLSEFLFLRLQP